MDKIQERIDVMFEKYDRICEIAEDSSSVQELDQAVEAFIAEYSKENLIQFLLIDMLQTSNAGRAAQLMFSLWLSGDGAFEMCKYLRENPEATEGQIMWKCRQILGRE